MGAAVLGFSGPVEIWKENILNGAQVRLAVPLRIVWPPHGTAGSQRIRTANTS